MSPHQRRVCMLLLCTAVVASECDGFGAASGTLRTQQIQLHAGWNSVFLEGYPQDTAPGVVFSNAPVTIAATYFPLANSVEFLTDPVRINWKKEGWSVWYAPRRSDS